MIWTCFRTSSDFQEPFLDQFVMSDVTLAGSRNVNVFSGTPPQTLRFIVKAKFSLQDTY